MKGFAILDETLETSRGISSIESFGFEKSDIVNPRNDIGNFNETSTK